MYEFFEGEIIEKNPAYAAIFISGCCYYVNISLTTYGQIQDLSKCSYMCIKLFVMMPIHCMDFLQNLKGKFSGC